MKDMKTIMIQQMVANLIKMDAVYFIQFGDATYTNLEEKMETKKKRAPSKYPLGELSKYIRNQIQEPLYPGVSGLVEAGEYDIESLRSTFTSYLSHKYGKNKFITHVEREKNCIWYVWKTDESINIDDKTMNLLEEIEK